jgi:hypothetical protein
MAKSTSPVWITKYGYFRAESPSTPETDFENKG